MDFHTMKRKELQALCKKHGIPANLKSTEMVDRLASISKQENEETIPKQNNDKEIEGKDDSEIIEPTVKKVKFSPQNQVFEYTRSVKKRATRRSEAKTKAIVAEAGKVLRRSREVAAKCNGEGTIEPHAASEISGDATETQESLSSSHVAKTGKYTRQSSRNAPKSIGEEAIRPHAASEISGNAYSRGIQVPLSTSLDAEAGKISRKSSRNAAKSNGEDIIIPHSVSIMSENADSSATQVPLSSPLVADAGKVGRRSSRNAPKSIGEDAIRLPAASEISGIAYSSGNQVFLSTSLDAEAGKISRKSSRNTAKRNGEDIVIPHSVSIMSENADSSETQVPSSSLLVADAGKVVRRSSRHAPKYSGEDMGKPHVVSKSSGNSNCSEAQVPVNGSLIPEPGKQSKKSNRNAAECSGEDNIRRHTVRMTSGNADSRETHVPMSCPLVSEEGKVVRRSNRHAAKISEENKEKPYAVNDVDSSKDQVTYRKPVAEPGKVSRRSRPQAFKCSGEDTGELNSPSKVSEDTGELNAPSKVSEDADSSETQVRSSRPLLAEAGAVSRGPSRKCIGEDTSKPHVVSKTSGKGDSRETQAPLRKSSRNALKRDLDAIMPAAEIAAKKKRNKAELLSAEEEDRLVESTIIQTESAVLVIPVAANNDLNVSARKQVLDSSVKKGKETRRKALTVKQLGSSHVTTVSNEKELTGSKVNIEETMDLTCSKSLSASEDQYPLPSAEEPIAPYTENVNCKEESDEKIIKENSIEDDPIVVPCHFSSVRGDSVSTCSAEVERGELQDNYQKVVSSETTSPIDGFTADSLPDFSVDSAAVNSGGDLNDGDLVGIGKTPVHKYSNKVKLKCDNLSSTRPATLNGALRDNQSEISENKSLNSKRTSTILLEDEEDANKKHYGETTGQTGFFADSNEIQDMTQLSKLVIAETDTERSTIICLTSSCHSFPQATPIRASSEGLDNESAVSFSVHNLTANREELKTSTVNLEGALDSTWNLINGSDDQNPEHFADEPSTTCDDTLNMKGEDEETLADDNIIESDGVGSFPIGPELMEFANDYTNAVTSESNIPAGGLSMSSQADLADLDEGSEAAKMISSSCDMDHFSVAKEESPERELPNAKLNEENITITSLANDADFALNLKKDLEIIESLNNMTLGHIRGMEDTQLVESDENLPHLDLKEVEECYQNESADFNQGIVPTEITNFMNSAVDKSSPTQNDQGRVVSYDDNGTIISVAHQADFAESSVAMELEKSLETTEPFKSWDFDRNEVGLSDSRMNIYTVADQVANTGLKNGCEMIRLPETVYSTGDLDNHNGVKTSLSLKLQSKIGLNDDVTITFEAYKADLADLEEGGETKESLNDMKSGVNCMDDQFAEHEKIPSPRDQNDSGLEDGNVFVESIRSDSNQDCKILMDAELLYNYNSEGEPAGLAEISAGTTDIQDVNFCMDDHIDGNDGSPSRNRNNDVTPSRKDHNDADLEDGKVSDETIRSDSKQDCKILKDAEELLYNYLSDGEPSELAQISAGGVSKHQDSLELADGPLIINQDKNNCKGEEKSCFQDNITKDYKDLSSHFPNTKVDDDGIGDSSVEPEFVEFNDNNKDVDSSDITSQYHGFTVANHTDFAASEKHHETTELLKNMNYGVASLSNKVRTSHGVSVAFMANQVDTAVIVESKKDINTTSSLKTLNSGDDFVDDHLVQNDQFLPHKDHSEVELSDGGAGYTTVDNPADYTGLEITEALKLMDYEDDDVDVQRDEDDETTPQIDNTGVESRQEDYTVTISVFEDQRMDIVESEGLNSEYIFMFPLETEECLSKHSEETSRQTENSDDTTELQTATIKCSVNPQDVQFDESDEAAPLKDVTGVELRQEDFTLTESVIGDQRMDFVDNEGLNLEYSVMVPTETEECLSKHSGEAFRQTGNSDDATEVQNISTKYNVQFDEDDETTPQRDNIGVELKGEDYTVTESVSGDQQMDIVESKGLNLEYSFMVPIECLSKHSGETTGRTENADDATYNVNSYNVQLDENEETAPREDNTGVELKQDDLTLTESATGDQRMDFVDSDSLNSEYSVIITTETEKCLSEHSGETEPTENSADATVVQNVTTEYNVNSHNVQLDENDETAPRKDNTGVELKQDDLTLTESVIWDQRMDFVESEGLNSGYSVMDPTETEECFSKHSGETTELTENSDDATGIQNVTSEYIVSSHGETTGQAESSLVDVISYSSLATPENAAERTTHIFLTSSGNNGNSSCNEKALASDSPSKTLSRNNDANTEVSALEVEAHTDVSEFEVEVTSTTVLREESLDQDLTGTAADEPLIIYENQIFEGAEGNIVDGEASTEPEQENNYIDAVFSEIKFPIDGFPEANQVDSSVEPNAVVDWEKVLDTKENITSTNYGNDNITVLGNEKIMLLEDQNKEGFNDLIENMKGRNDKTLLLEDQNKEGLNDLIDQNGVGIQNADDLVENGMNDGDENEGLDLEQSEEHIHNHFSEETTGRDGNLVEATNNARFSDITAQTVSKINYMSSSFNNVPLTTPFEAPPESRCFRNESTMSSTPNTLFKHDMKENFGSRKNIHHNGHLTTPKTSSRRALEELGRSNR